MPSQIQTVGARSARGGNIGVRPRAESAQRALRNICASSRGFSFCPPAAVQRPRPQRPRRNGGTRTVRPYRQDVCAVPSCR